ncbi:sigma-54-dependent Fis family transcriptional regulator [Bacillus sp. TH007]|uniref:sigma-54-dependent Fis family transcriptional regulator n=1 Tax=Bacillus sp. TH007 TaxID=1664037 RepID=UPI00071DEDFD|nr:sigma-54-dependent Fis family transcriptional regulator [Bacillus sp. TH007]KRV44232.1 transcriptional regulator [Bacillus sp. TH007]
MSIKVLGIAPYKGLGDVLIDLAKDEKSITFQLEVGDLRSGVALAEQAEAQGMDIIMSRGGTAALIQKHVNIPVVDIPVSGYDLLRALTLIKDYQGKKAVVGFENITQGVRTIGELYGIKIDIYTIQQEEEVWDLLQQLQEQGTQVVLGDVITDKAAKELGMQSMLITSGRESVKEAFHQAKQMYRLYKEATAEQRLFREMIDQESKGMLIIDQHNQLYFINQQMKEWTEKGLFAPFTSHIDVMAWCPALEPAVKAVREGKQNGYSQISFQQQVWHVKGNLLSKGELLLTIEKPSAVINREGQRIWTLAAPVHSAHPFALFTEQSSNMKDVIKRAKAFSQTDRSICLYGEQGTGKSSLAFAIHQMSERKNESFMTVHCSRLAELDDVNIIPVHQKGTIFLKDIDRVPMAMQPLMAEQLIHHQQNIRWMAASTVDLFKLMQSGAFHEDLYTCLQELVIHVPPLSERAEDIEDMSRLFIAELNSLYGTQVVGLSADVIAAFQNERFRENVRQFKRIMEELVLTTKSGYITLSKAKPAIEQLASENEEKQLSSYLHGTLDEIERRIIRTVLEEENMNQSKAAKRLNINRTTLWRKLKE